MIIIIFGSLWILCEVLMSLCSIYTHSELLQTYFLNTTILQIPPFDYTVWLGSLGKMQMGLHVVTALLFPYSQDTGVSTADNHFQEDR